MKRTLQFVAAVAVLAMTPIRCVRSFAAVTDADIWWHLRTAGWIVEHHGFPHTGIFTQYPERVWIAYSWGFELLAWRAFQAFLPNGLAGLTVFLIALQAAIGTALLWSLQRLGRNAWLACLLTAITLYATDALAIRPLLFSILFYVVELYVLLKSDEGSEMKFFDWLPALFLVWANIHIQFVYGLFVLGLFALGVTVSQYSPRRGMTLEPSTITARRAWMIFGGSLLASCIGPYGPTVYRTIFAYAGNTTQYEQVIEFAAINFRRPTHYVELLLVLSGFFAVGWRHSRNVFRVVLMAATTLVAFRSMRDGWFAAIVAAMLIAEAFGEKKTEVEAPALRNEGRWSLAAMVVAIGLSIGVAAREGLNAQTLIRPIDQQYPVRAVEFIRQHRLPGPMYNTFNWGGYLIFNLREYPVSMDGRTDLFGPELDTRAMATVNAYDLEHDAAFQEANLVILERMLPLAGYLARNPRYELVYEDEIAAVFVKQKY